MARVLLVDDDPQLLQIASTLLLQAQFDVMCCENAMEALEQARKQDFDIVVTDVNMKPHSGFDLVRSLKQIPAYDSTPIAMLSGRREKRDVERALAAGVKNYIVKPIDPEQFIRKMSELAVQSESIKRNSRFAQLEINEVALCQIPLVLVRITETGAVLDSDHRLHVGSIVKVSSDIFNRIGAPNPELRVVSCTQGASEGTFEVRAHYTEIDERALLKIRQYIQARAFPNRRPQKAS